MPHMRGFQMMIEKKIRLTNYDKYDRRKALKKFLDASYLRHKIDDEEDMENFENDLSNIEIREQNDSKPELFAENPNSFALFFKDLYKVDNRNPKAKASSKYLLNKYLHLSDERRWKWKSVTTFTRRR